MNPCRSARLKDRGSCCFKVLFNNAKRLVSNDANSANTLEHFEPSRESDINRTKQAMTFSKTKRYLNNQASRDLKRFLEEVGTDSKEARFWLRHFQSLELKTEKPFAVVELDSTVFSDENMLERVASSLAFLYRNGMETVVVHGVSGSQYGIPDKSTKNQLLEDNLKLVDMLESHDARARPFMSSSHLISVKTRANQLTDLDIHDADINCINWCLSSGHIPVITAVGETDDGHVVYTDPTSTVVKLASLLKPTKVIFLNSTGGLRDQDGKVIDCVSIPEGIGTLLQAPWLDKPSLHMVQLISSLIPEMPQHTSAVITSADSLIKELFTHSGCGTLFQPAERINVYNSLDDVDVDRLWQLLVKSFKKSLDKNYFSLMQNQLDSIYVTESYTAAAIIIKPQETGNIPYLDKFSISKESQGLGTSNLLWEKIRHDYPKICWRSRGTNKINPWYFVRSSGSSQNGHWTVFWYGVSDPEAIQQIIQYTCSLPSSFDPIAPHDEQGKKLYSTSEYHKYL